MIHGKRINLRLVRQSDMDELFNLNTELKRRGDHFPIRTFSEPAFKKNFSETGFWGNEFYGMLITDKSDRMIGRIQVWKSFTHFDCYEVGYIIFDPIDWGKGYMSEAVNLMVPYIFDLLPIARIQATTPIDNTGSQKVIEKCGFTYEGILRKAAFHRGEYVDVKMFSILREESGPLAEQWQDE